MAKIWNHLRHHEDTTAKRPITPEELKFLADLQKEMNTQDTVGQADPRYWVIQGTVKEFGFEEGAGDGFKFYLNDEPVAETIQELAAFMPEQVDDVVEAHVRGDVIDVVLKDGEEDCLFDMNEILGFYEDRGLDLSVSYYRNLPINYSGPVFLTEKAAAEHLRSNDYHYSDDAHTFAQTAWRSSEMEKLYEILHEVDFGGLAKPKSAFLYKEFCDEEAWGEEIDKIFPTREAAEAHLKSQVEDFFNRKADTWEELEAILRQEELILEQDTFDPDFVSLISSGPYYFWQVDELPVEE